MGEDLGDDWGDMIDRLEAGEDLGENGDLADDGGGGLDDGDDAEV
jgi:hypothetical protein